MTIAPELDPDPALAARAAAARPTMRLDPQAVLGAAHRHARRRAAARVGVGAAAAAAVAMVVVSLTGPVARSPEAPAGRATEPAPTTQVPQAIGDGDVSTLADGIKAVNLRGPSQPPAPGVSSAIPGIAHEYDLGLAGPDGTSIVMLTSDATPEGTAGLLVTYADDTGEPTQVGDAELPVWAWGGDTGQSPNDAPWATATPDATHRLDVALVPADLPQPRALYWTTDGASDTAWQEVPTFDTGNGRLVTVFTTTGELPASAGLAFVGSDGRIVEAPCPASARCTGLDEVPGVRAQLQLLSAAGQAQTQAAWLRVSDAEAAVQAAKAKTAAATTAAERDAADDELAAAQKQLDAAAGALVHGGP